MHESKASGDTPQIARREFLARGLTAGIGTATFQYGELAAGAENPAQKPDAPELSHAIPQRDFGKTGRRLPILAFGGSAMVEKWKATDLTYQDADRKLLAEFSAEASRSPIVQQMKVQ